MVATQGLFMLNDPSVMDAAEVTARRVLQDSSTEEIEQAGRVHAGLNRMFELLLMVQPTEEERQDLRAFMAATRQRFEDEKQPDAEVRAWAMVCHALFASSRFQVLE